MSKEKMTQEEREQILKLAMLFFANCQLQLELIEELKATPIYKHKVKSLVKNLTKELEAYVEQIFQLLDDEDSQKQFYLIAGLNEAFLEAIKGREQNDMTLLKELLQEYTAGKIGILPENKHKKIFNQLEKV